jgi:hypothetical protein
MAGTANFQRQSREGMTESVLAEDTNIYHEAGL